ncbi:hypothetical protein EDB84DRAFT_1518053, partial [Lactarius hengduanensis]
VCSATRPLFLLSLACFSLLSPGSVIGFWFCTYFAPFPLLLSLGTPDSQAQDLVVSNLPSISSLPSFHFYHHLRSALYSHSLQFQSSNPHFGRFTLFRFLC